MKINNVFGGPKTLDEIEELLGVSGNIRFKGYVIHLPKQDEFVAIFERQGIFNTIGYAKKIEHAFIYDNELLAIDHAERIDNYNVHVCTLVETDNQLIKSSIVFSNFN